MVVVPSNLSTGTDFMQKVISLRNRSCMVLYTSIDAVFDQKERPFRGVVPAMIQAVSHGLNPPNNTDTKLIIEWWRASYARFMNNVSELFGISGTYHRSWNKNEERLKWTDTSVELPPKIFNIQLEIRAPPRAQWLSIILNVVAVRVVY